MEHLHSLNLPSLHYRRTRGDMIILYRMLHDNFNVDVSQFFILPTSVIRGHNLKIFKMYSICLARINYFTSRVINNNNYLPSIIVNSVILNSFKNCYFSDIKY